MKNTLVFDEIAKRVKERKIVLKKKNTTFKITHETMEAFRNKCQKNELSMSAAVEELIEEFIK